METVRNINYLTENVMPITCIARLCKPDFSPYSSILSNTEIEKVLSSIGVCVDLDKDRLELTNFEIELLKEMYNKKYKEQKMKVWKSNFQHQFDSLLKYLIDNDLASILLDTKDLTQLAKDVINGEPMTKTSYMTLSRKLNDLGFYIELDDFLKEVNKTQSNIIRANLVCLGYNERMLGLNDNELASNDKLDMNDWSKIKQNIRKDELKYIDPTCLQVYNKLDNPIIAIFNKRNDISGLISKFCIYPKTLIAIATTVADYRKFKTIARIEKELLNLFEVNSVEEILNLSDEVICKGLDKREAIKREYSQAGEDTLTLVRRFIQVCGTVKAASVVLGVSKAKFDKYALGRVKIKPLHIKRMKEAIYNGK